MFSTETWTHIMPLLALLLLLLLLLLFQVRGPPAKAAFDASGVPQRP
jgi:hypothetical protein